MISPLTWKLRGDLATLVGPVRSFGCNVLRESAVIMRRRQFWTRLIIAFAIFGGLLALCVFPPIYRDYQRYSRSRDEARILVRAIYEYKAKTGHWPASLSDLVPDFLVSVPDRWAYRGGVDGIPTEIRKLGFQHTYLIYYFPPADDPCFPPGIQAGWVEDNEGNRRYLPDG